MSRPIAETAQATAAAGTTRRCRSVKPLIARSVSSGIARMRAAETSDSVGLRMPSADATPGALIFDALGHDLEAERMPEVGRRANDRGAVLVGGDPRHERPIDLHGVHREPMEIRE